MGVLQDLQKTLTLVQQDPFFYSIQGEGKWTGRLTSWLRSSKCNLKCVWDNRDGTVTYCDTAYSSHIPEENIVTIKEAYGRLTSTEARYVGISGGEPFLQKNILTLVDMLETSSFKTTIETNGTIFRKCEASLISLSPKLLSSSTGLKGSSFVRHNKRRYNGETLRRFVEYYGWDRLQFKFVINDQCDIDEIISKYVRPLRIPNDNIFLMPQGVTHEQLNDRADWVVEQCKKYGWNYSDRVHVRIWNDKVGV